MFDIFLVDQMKTRGRSVLCVFYIDKIENSVFLKKEAGTEALK